RKKFEDGITPRMTADAVARLIGLTADTSVVRIQTGEKAGPPLDGEIDIKEGEHFIVTRKNVEGGFDDMQERIATELGKLRDSGQRVTFIESPPAVVYHDLPCAAENAPVQMTDVMVQVPSGYAVAPLDYAFL